MNRRYAFKLAATVAVLPLLAACGANSGDDVTLQKIRTVGLGISTAYQVGIAPLLTSLGVDAGQITKYVADATNLLQAAASVASAASPAQALLAVAPQVTALVAGYVNVPPAVSEFIAAVTSLAPVILPLLGVALAPPAPPVMSEAQAMAVLARLSR